MHCLLSGIVQSSQSPARSKTLRGETNRAATAFRDIAGRVVGTEGGRLCSDGASTARGFVSAGKPYPTRSYSVVRA